MDIFPTVSMDFIAVYHAVYMDCVGVDELKSKLACLFGIQSHQIGDIFMQGPSGIHIMVTDEVRTFVECKIYYKLYETG